MYIIMLGAPGTGKGTIGKILSSDMNLGYIATGNMFREEINKQTELGKEVEGYMEKGLLVPDGTTIKIVKSRLLEESANNGVILDGFPRTVEQARALKEFLSENDPEQKIIAIELKVPDEEIIKRIINRVTCSNRSCGAIYNLETRPPKNEGICDICGSKLKRRVDDNEETIRQRLKVYDSNSQELLTFYEKNNALYSVDAVELATSISQIKEYLQL